MFLNKIVSWQDWSHPDTGMKAVLLEELKDFTTSHHENISSKLVSGSTAHTLAILSCTESVSWLESLINFIDEFMEYLTTAKFSNKKALSLTTRLAKRILVEVFRGIMKSVEVP